MSFKSVIDLSVKDQDTIHLNIVKNWSVDVQN